MEFGTTIWAPLNTSLLTVVKSALLSQYGLIDSEQSFFSVGHPLLIILVSSVNVSFSHDLLPGNNSHRLGYGMCHFFRVLFWLKNKFLGLFIAFN